jgi:hypothetical protein
MTGGRPPLALPLSAAVIDRSARALAKAKPLDWDAMPEHWRAELRRQAIAALLAAIDEPPPAAPTIAP